MKRKLMTKLMTKGCGLVVGIALMLTACGETAVQSDSMATMQEGSGDQAEAGKGQDKSSAADTAGARKGAGGATSFAVNNVQEKQKVQEAQKELELSEFGWHATPNSYGETIYVKFCGLLYNPNTSLKAEFPKVNATVRNGAGEILATGSQTGASIMPQDTVTLIGQLSLSKAEITEDTRIEFDVECSSFSPASALDGPKTTDFTIENVSERGSGWDYKITGEVTNNTSAAVDMAALSILLRKEGKIVYMETSFLDSLQPGKAKPFEVPYLNDVPEHDTIDVSVQAW